MLGADETRHDAPPSRKSGKPPLPVLIGAAAAAVALIVAAVVAFNVLGSDAPPGKLATVFSDDFSQDGSGWGGGQFTSGYGYKDAKFRIETNSAYNPHSRGAPKDAQDLPDRLLSTVTVKVEQGAPDSRVGMLARATENGDRQYMIFVRADGKGALIRKNNGDLGTKELVNVDSVPGWAEGETNKLQVACESQDGGKKVRLRLWVNDKQVLDITDTDQPLPNGPSGITVERGGNAAQQVVADFDDFDMSKILD
ncbi:hypothetical protein [Spirillospora albida]|uniref:hypothetical protein n=1 Tax=Spirillospora albida TaxID=58123 RepID=UPI0004C2840A|nr:hypothetical protein [Spirillospora albida]